MISYLAATRRHHYLASAEHLLNRVPSESPKLVGADIVCLRLNGWEKGVLVSRSADPLRV